jgi:hypothetical protein
MVMDTVDTMDKYDRMYEELQRNFKNIPDDFTGIVLDSAGNASAGHKNIAPEALHLHLFDECIISPDFTLRALMEIFNKAPALCKAFEQFWVADWAAEFAQRKIEKHSSVEYIVIEEICAFTELYFRVLEVKPLTHKATAEEVEKSGAMGSKAKIGSRGTVLWTAFTNGMADVPILVPEDVFIEPPDAEEIQRKREIPLQLLDVFRTLLADLFEKSPEDMRNNPTIGMVLAGHSYAMEIRKL